MASFGIIIGLNSYRRSFSMQLIYVRFMLSLAALLSVFSCPAIAEEVHGMANAKEHLLVVSKFPDPEIALCVQRRLEIMIPHLRSIDVPKAGENFYEVMLICSGQNPKLACAAKVSQVYGAKFVDQIIKPDVDPQMRQWLLLNLSQSLDLGVDFGSADRVCERLAEMIGFSILRDLAR
jgi:hypothetical protein